MPTKPKRLNERLAVIHETALGLHNAGFMSPRTMREFDALCLTPVKEFPPKAIVRLREKANVSQAVLARHLNVSLNTISQWERGEKRPSGPSLKLLTLAEKKGLFTIA